MGLVDAPIEHFDEHIGVLFKLNHKSLLFTHYFKRLFSHSVLVVEEEIWVAHQL